MQAKVKSLEKELARKEKDLAEAAALLILKKSPSALQFGRGQMTSTALPQELLELSEETSRARHLLGLSVRTVQRWRQQSEDPRPKAKRNPANKLNEIERQKIINVSIVSEFADLPPNQIVPRLADQGCYLASEATFYKILQGEKILKHRDDAGMQIGLSSS